MGLHSYYTESISTKKDIEFFMGPLAITEYLCTAPSLQISLLRLSVFQSDAVQRYSDLALGPMKNPLYPICLDVLNALLRSFYPTSHLQTTCRRPAAVFIPQWTVLSLSLATHPAISPAERPVLRLCRSMARYRSARAVKATTLGLSIQSCPVSNRSPSVTYL